jgi:hypothetical protein
MDLVLQLCMGKSVWQDKMLGMSSVKSKGKGK